MPVNLEVESKTIIEEILYEFNLIQKLFSDGKIKIMTGRIESIKKKILKLSDVNDALIARIFADLETLKREIETNFGDAEKSFGTYFEIIRDDIENIKNEISAKYPGKKKRETMLNAIERTYGRIMDEKEFSELTRTGILTERKPGQLIPVFEAPPKIVDFFMNRITRDKAHNLIQALGGSGNQQYIVIFSTKIKPFIAGIPSKHLPQIKEAKFDNDTKVRIFKWRKI